MKKNNHSFATKAVHVGSDGDATFGGVTNAIYTASAYDYETDGIVRYPRYFNTPNHQAVAAKMAALENADEALMFSSGMAAIMTGLLGLLKSGDHVIFQSDLYGGTHFAALHQLNRFNISYTMVKGNNLDDYEAAIQENTKVMYIETPSNPLLKITDIAGVVKLAKTYKLLTMIDNTFASPFNQNPLSLGIDVVVHSGTKYIGGHSDIICGVVLGSRSIIKKIKKIGVNFGGCLDAHTCYLVERSLKTLPLRVAQQNKNAMKVAQFLVEHAAVANVYYPGLKDHVDHKIAKRQMKGGFGGMLSFETKRSPERFLRKLKMIKKAISLGGVETTISSPHKTSHAKLTPQERQDVGISDNLIRVSIGIEAVDDIIQDINQALGAK